MSNDQNPFGMDANPFADPSVQNVTRNVQRTQQTLDDYNPFASSNAANTKPAIIPTSSQPSTTAVPAFTSQYTGPSEPTSSSTLPTSASGKQLNLTDIEKQQQELERRAAELERRERMLTAPTNQKNFPPLPLFCPIKPCFYQDISVEIPMEFQKWVRLLFYLWLGYTATLGYNVIAALVILIITGSHGITFGLSMLYFIVFTAATYVGWFRTGYKAFRTDSSVNFMAHFFVSFVHIVVCCLEVIGFIDSGFCGIITTIKVFSGSGAESVVAGFFSLVATILFAASLFGAVLILMKIHKLYRNTDASLEKAQQELATNIMSNKNVQSAATTVITESAKASFKQASNGRF